jgi:hypothetical protein
VNHLKSYGRWAFAEFREVYQIEAGFKAKVESDFNKMIAAVAQDLQKDSGQKNKFQRSYFFAPNLFADGCPG